MGRMDHKHKHCFAGCMARAVSIYLSAMALVMAFGAGQAWSMNTLNETGEDIPSACPCLYLSIAGACLPQQVIHEENVPESAMGDNRCSHAEIKPDVKSSAFGICLPLSPMIKTGKSYKQIVDDDVNLDLAYHNAMCLHYEALKSEIHSSWKSKV